MIDARQQVITGVVPPELGEAKIREAWPSVAAMPTIASVGRLLTRTIFLAPAAWMLMSMAYLGKVAPLLIKVLNRTVVLAPLAWLVWLLVAPLYLLGVLPFMCRRYTLTNRRFMVRPGWEAPPLQAINLADIDEVRVQTDVNSRFFRAGTLEIISKGQVVMILAGVPEPDSFRHAILNSCAAWVPGKAKELLPFVAASESK